MDMEILQEYTENQYYLRAITSINFEHLEFEAEKVAEEFVSTSRPNETMEEVLSQPIGNMLFRYHLNRIGAVEYLLFLNEVENFESFKTANKTFKKNLAIKIYNQYIESNLIHLKMPRHVLKRLKEAFSGTFENFPRDDIFLNAKMSAFRILLLSCFPSFLERYYL